MYIDKLDDIVHEYNNTYHRTIKMKSIDVRGITYINTDKEVNDNDPKLRVGVAFLLKAILQFGLKKFLSLNQLKIQFHRHMLLMILMMKKLLEHLE